MDFDYEYVEHIQVQLVRWEMRLSKIAKHQQQLFELPTHSRPMFIFMGLNTPATVSLKRTKLCGLREINCKQAQQTTKTRQNEVIGKQRVYFDCNYI